MDLRERWTVYELINETAREIYVGRTTLPVYKLASELAKERPQAIAHWDLDHATTVRSVEFGLAEKDARTFITSYTRTRLPPSWKYLKD